MKTGIMALDSRLAVTINRLIRTQIDLPLRTPFIHIILITQTGASVKPTPCSVTFSQSKGLPRLTDAENSKFHAQERVKKLLLAMYIIAEKQGEGDFDLYHSEYECTPRIRFHRVKV